MGKTHPFVDNYIAQAEDFAKPVLEHLRALIHEVCPEAEETKKWSFPNFVYHGAILCSMAAFKQHCSFGFWKQGLMPDPDHIFGENTEGMGSIGKLTSLKDLPKDSVLKKYIREAMKLNELGIKPPAKTKPKETKELVTPDLLVAALQQNKTAGDAWNKFSYSHKKEYIEWITEAKTEATRNKRIATTIEWLVEGKSRNWKYQNC